MTDFVSKSLSGAFRLARGTATMLGLVVMFAAVLGLGTAALAAVPGDPLKLGQRNAMDTLTTLAGSANGALLSVENGSPGAKGAPASALALKVAPANPPLRVNAEAGTATNLSADELDGKDAGAFLASDGKAADADELDGKDASAYFSGKSYIVQREAQGSGGGVITVTAACDNGDNLLSGGGGSMTDIQDDVNISRPLSSREWSASFQDNGTSSKFFAQALCADFPPLRP